MKRLMNAIVPPNRFHLLLAAMLLVALGSGLLLTRPLQAQGPAPQGTVLGTAFTYQGRLTDAAGNPIAGPCDLRFTLYESLAGNDPVGAPQTVPGVAPSNGYFTAALDFGAAAFRGDGRYLGIEVNCGGGYTPLIPRLALTPAPYALHASSAGALHGRPVSDSAPAAGDVLAWNGSAWLPTAPGGGGGGSYARVVVVAQSGGDYTSIQAALNSIGDAAWDNRYLVWVAPGRYVERVTMKPYVDIEGAGEQATRILYTGSPWSDTGTVVGADEAELRFLTVENTGGSDVATAICNNGSSPHLTHVTAVATGGTSANYGVANWSGSAATLTRVTASAAGNNKSYGVYNYASSPTLLDVTATASGAANDNFGVANQAGGLPILRDVTAAAAGGIRSYGVYNTNTAPEMTGGSAVASGANYSYGVYNDAASPTIARMTIQSSGAINSYGVYNAGYSAPRMTTVLIQALGGNICTGVYNFHSEPTIQNSVIHASGGGSNYGINNQTDVGVYTVRVNNCQITGTNNTIIIAGSGGAFDVYVGASLMDGGPVSIGSGLGNVTCAGAYDENYIFYDGSCP